MALSLLLPLHLGAALATLLAIFFTLFVLSRGTASLYRRCALLIGFIAAFEILTGTLLAVLSPEISAAYLATHIAMYLGACFVVEALLFVRMQRVSLAFPLRLLVSPVFASLALWISSVYLQF